MNDTEPSSRFTIQDEETPAPPDALYLADAENLKIEKLSMRITLVAILIPCLLVVVLAVAYLDIKKRVINTQNSGSVGVQTLSKDLDSRFSNLSLKQAKVEAQVTEQGHGMETAMAAMQVTLKKGLDEIRQHVETKVDRTDLEKLAVSAGNSATTIVSLQKDLAELNAAFEKFDETLASQIQLIADGVKKDQHRVDEMAQAIQRLDSEKLGRASLDLAIGIERLALQELVKEKQREVDKQLAKLGKEILTLNQRLDEMARKAAAGLTSAVPTVSGPVSPPLPPPVRETPGGGTATIIEQTID